MSDLFYYDDTFFYVPYRRFFENFVSTVCDDDNFEEAMWKIDKILYDMKHGDVSKIFCVR